MNDLTVDSLGHARVIFVKNGGEIQCLKRSDRYLVTSFENFSGKFFLLSPLNDVESKKGTIYIFFSSVEYSIQFDAL